MEFFPRRRALVVLALLAATFAPLPGRSARGQFRLAFGPEQLYTSQRVNLFLDVEGSESYDGAYLAIPSGWQLDEATLASANGRTEAVSYRPLDQPGNRFLLVSGHALRETDRLILQLRTGPLSGPCMVTITPVRTRSDGRTGRAALVEGLSVRNHFVLDEDHTTSGNEVLRFNAALREPYVAPASAPGGGDAFTAELWLKTTSLGAVLLSTWDGGEDSSYPLELLTDAAGYVVFFRGMPGEHRSMRSMVPVADGSWHHIAVAHDPDRRWSRLYVDGVPADSIYHASRLQISDPAGISLGGRLSESTGEAAVPSRPFIGLMDEVRVWNYSRSASEIRRDMRRPVPSSDAVSVLSFEDAVPGAPTGDADALEVVSSDLSFYEPIREFEVRLDPASVLLEWLAPDPNVLAFGIERSSDGVSFEEVARVDRRRADRLNDPTEGFHYRDTAVAYGVTFYRIRQYFSDGAESVSRDLKVGMGPDEAEGTAILLGNFPNPFNPSTTINYVLREDQPIQISVWDLAGQMVALLVDGQQDAGEHQVQFDAQDLPSGTYFVRMRSAEGMRSHQIILTK